jgi:hypothetical protein
VLSNLRPGRVGFEGRKKSMVVPASRSIKALTKSMKRREIALRARSSKGNFETNLPTDASADAYLAR